MKLEGRKPDETVPCRPLLICLGLKKQTLATVTAAIDCIREQSIWKRFQTKAVQL